MRHLLSKARRLARETNGNVAMVFALLLVPLIAMGGAGIDLARYEAIRVEMQDGLDRGVLAAASLSQKEKPEDTLRSFMKNLDYAQDIALNFTETKGLNSRKINASAAYVMNTTFIHLVGVRQLSVAAVSTAEEAKQNIEMSLMLDMSGSMNGNRIKNLKKAAQQFIDQVLTDETKDYTTITIVPYAGHVNIGAAVFDKLGAKRDHSNSSCVELSTTGFGSGVPSFKDAAQVPHFTQWNYGRTDLKPWWCPVESTAITYFSNDATYLKNRITQLELHDGTGTQNAMQWGYMLLNPGAKTIVNAAIDAKMMDAKFANRPAAFGDPDTMKVIVLMTDGAITEQYRPKDYSRPVSQAPDNKQIINSTDTAKMLSSVCTAAKTNGITVFTIGFEVSGNATTQMTNCATSPGHYYPASGSGIGDAFKSISTSIKKLRLTQ
ncbi:TadE/TadG family type IV pilus assembly protein [Rhizobium sp. SIMBA_035]